jgi:hypothetical protein
VLDSFGKRDFQRRFLVGERLVAAISLNGYPCSKRLTGTLRLHMNLNLMNSIQSTRRRGPPVLYSIYCYLVPQNLGIPMQLTLQKVVLSSEPFFTHK